MIELDNSSPATPDTPTTSIEASIASVTTVAFLSGAVLLSRWASTGLGINLTSATAIATLAWALAALQAVRSEPYRLFSLAAGYVGLLGLFHLGLVVPIALGADVNSWQAWVLQSEAPKALVLVAIAFCGFAAGVGLLQVVAANSPGQRGPLEAGFWACGDDTILTAGMLIAVLGLLLSIAFGYRIHLFSASYAERYLITGAAEQGSIDGRLYYIGTTLFYMSFPICGIGAGRGRVKGVFFAFLPFLLMQVMLGVRGYPVAYMIAFLLIWYRQNRRQAWAVIGTATVAGLILLPLAKLAREHPNQSATYLLSQVSPQDLVMEAGGSLRPVVETLIELDAHHEPEWHGRSYLIALGRILPNVSLGNRKVVTLGDAIPSEWISAKAEPSWFAQLLGIGYSAIAEPYLNFGIWGVAPIFLLYGLLVAGGERLLQKGPYWAVAVMVAYPTVIWLVRNDSYHLFRGISWALMMAGAIYIGRPLLQSLIPFRPRVGAGGATPL